VAALGFRSRKPPGKSCSSPTRTPTGNHPRGGRRPCRCFETAGIHVEIPDGVTSTGRPAHSKGFLDRSRERARTNVEALAPRVEDGWEVVLVRALDAVMLQSDYLDLLRDATPSGSGRTPTASWSISIGSTWRPDSPTAELDERLTYHGHCHQKATKKDGHAAAVLRTVGYEVDALDSGCCGMAGSFGYEAEHYSLSRSIGQILFRIRSTTARARPSSRRARPVGRNSPEYEGCDDPPHPIESVAAGLSR